MTLLRGIITFSSINIMNEKHKSTQPGAREEMAEVELSVRRNTLAIGQAVDLAGEQSYMRTAKIAGT